MNSIVTVIESRSRQGARSPPPLSSRKTAFVFAAQPASPTVCGSQAEAAARIASNVPTGVVSAGTAGDDEEDDDGLAVYQPLSLITTQRKRDQIVLLRQQIRALKLAFNARFDELCR